MRVLSFLIRMVLVVGCALTLAWGLILLGYSYREMFELVGRWSLSFSATESVLRPLLSELNRLFWGLTLLSASAALYQYAKRPTYPQLQETSTSRTLLLLLLSTCCLLVTHTLDLPAKNPLTYVYLSIVVVALCLSIRFGRGNRDTEVATEDFFIAEPPAIEETWAPRQRKISDPFFAAEMSFLDNQAEIPRHNGWKIFLGLSAAGLAAIWLATHRISLAGRSHQTATQTTPRLEPAPIATARVFEADAEVAFLTIAIYSEPPEAHLFIDGELKGITPLTITLPAGDHRVTLEKAGYKLAEQALVSPFTEGSVHYPLEQISWPASLHGRAGLKVLCDRNTVRRIFVDDIDTGVNCPTVHRLEVAAGSHKVGIFSPHDGKKFEFVRDIEDSHFSTRIYLRP